MLFKKQKHEKGFALLLAMIVASVVLSIGISILNVSVNQLTLSSTARESEIAFQSSRAIMDCVRYWRNESASDYIGGVSPSLQCFGEAPVTSSVTPVTGNINRFSYQFEWGTPLRCAESQMYMMNAQGGAVNHTFSGTSVGINGNGNKTCEDGGVCTVIFAQGYNRSCSELTTSIFTVQRELTTEF